MSGSDHALRQVRQVARGRGLARPLSGRRPEAAELVVLRIDRVHVLAQEVRAEADVVDARGLDHVLEVIDDSVERPASTNVGRTCDQSNEPAY